MGVKTTHRVFFAIPFDVATKSMYKNLAEGLGGEFTIIMGTEIKDLGPSPPRYNDIATFKAQNVELFSQFVAQIRSADVIVADLTHNNPNVHVELGIALTLNKNILRVTGRALTELGFDIRGFEVKQYKNSGDLLEKIRDYLKLFEEIKDLPLSEEAGPFYHHHPNFEHLNAYEPEPGVLSIKTLPEFQRDGAIQVRFEFRRQRFSEDWFGIYLRSSPSPQIRSCLVYVRKNGSVELVTYPHFYRDPTPMILGRLPDEINSEKVLLVEIEGNAIRASIDGLSMRPYEWLAIQDPGWLRLGCWRSDVRFGDVKVVCRDTIDFPVPPGEG